MNDPDAGLGGLRNQARPTSPFYVSPTSRGLTALFQYLGLVPMVIIFGWVAWRVLCH